MKALSRVNPRLPPEKRVLVIDNYLAEEFNLQSYPIVRKFDKEGFEVYPYCYIDGIVVNPAPAQLVLYTLNGLLKEEFLVK